MSAAHTFTPHRVDHGWIVTCSCGWTGTRTRKQLTALQVAERDHLARINPPCPTPHKRRFKTEQTAEHSLGLQVSTKTVDRMVVRGEIRAVPIGERLIRFDLNEVDAMLTASAQDAVS